MPELPEVETIARSLREGGRTGPSILRQTIDAADLYWPRSLAMPTFAELAAQLPGQRVERVGRRGKFLMLGLSRDALLFHLRMSGDIRVEPDDRPPAPHDRFLLHFDRGQRLAFNDPRKFGRIWLVADPQVVLTGLGPEPLEPGFTPELLYARLRERRRQIKPLLLDQGFLAGLGNIYTDEALHRARLHPLRLADSVTQAEATALWAAIREVLQEGIYRQGASIDWVYRGGDFQNHFSVYGREGEPCPVCGTPIERIVVGQRGTHFCPSCQKRNPHI